MLALLGLSHWPGINIPVCQQTPTRNNEKKEKGKPTIANGTSGVYNSIAYLYKHISAIRKSQRAVIFFFFFLMQVKLKYSRWISLFPRTFIYLDRLYTAFRKKIFIYIFFYSWTYFSGLVRLWECCKTDLIPLDNISNCINRKFIICSADNKQHTRDDFNESLYIYTFRIYFYIFFLSANFVLNFILWYFFLQIIFVLDSTWLRFIEPSTLNGKSPYNVGFIKLRFNLQYSMVVVVLGGFRR